METEKGIGIKVFFRKGEKMSWTRMDGQDLVGRGGLDILPRRGAK